MEDKNLVVKTIQKNIHLRLKVNHRQEIYASLLHEKQHYSFCFAYSPLDRVHISNDAAADGGFCLWVGNVAFDIPNAELQGIVDTFGIRFTPPTAKDAVAEAGASI